MEKAPCRYCGSNSRVQRSGYNRGGSQRLRCEDCQRYFTPEPKPRGYESELRRQALKLYLEGMSLRGIGRQLSITHQSVSNWLNAYHDQVLPAQVEDDTPTEVVEVVEVVEVDELYTFVGKKREKAIKAIKAIKAM